MGLFKKKILPAEQPKPVPVQEEEDLEFDIAQPENIEPEFPPKLGINPPRELKPEPVDLPRTQPPSRPPAAQVQPELPPQPALLNKPVELTEELLKQILVKIDESIQSLDERLSNIEATLFRSRIGV